MNIGLNRVITQTFYARYHMHWIKIERFAGLYNLGILHFVQNEQKSTASNYSDQ